MLTGSPVNFSVITMLVGSFVADHNKRSSKFIKILILLALAAFSGFEIYNHAQQRENVFKLFGITPKSTSGEFRSAARTLKGQYHPDNSYTANNELFIRINELSESLETDYNSKVEAYTQFGDRFDILSRFGPNKDQLWNLEVGKGIDYVANYLMIALICTIFFQNSAKRGWVQWGLIILTLLMGLIVDILIGNPIDLEDNGTFYDVGDFFREVLNTPHATNVDLSQTWRLCIVTVLCEFLLYGILFQPKDSEQLMSLYERYYIMLHRAARKIDQGQPNHPDVIEAAQDGLSLLRSAEPALVVLKGESANNAKFFGRLKSMQSVIYYGALIILVGFNLFSKYKTQIFMWLQSSGIVDWFNSEDED